MQGEKNEAREGGLETGSACLRAGSTGSSMSAGYLLMSRRGGEVAFWTLEAGLTRFDLERDS